MNKILNLFKDFVAPHSQLEHYIEIENIDQIKKIAKRVQRLPTRSKIRRLYGFDYDREIITGALVVKSLKPPIFRALHCSDIEVLKTVLENTPIVLFCMKLIPHRI